MKKAPRMMILSRTGLAALITWKVSMIKRVSRHPAAYLEMAVLVSEEDHDRQAADDDALQHQ